MIFGPSLFSRRNVVRVAEARLRRLGFGAAAFAKGIGSLSSGYGLNGWLAEP